MQIYHYIISMYYTLINKNNQQFIYVKSNIIQISKCIMYSGTPGMRILYKMLELMVCTKSVSAKRRKHSGNVETSKNKYT